MKQLIILTIVAVSIALIAAPIKAEELQGDQPATTATVFLTGETTLEHTMCNDAGVAQGRMKLKITNALGIEKTGDTAGACAADMLYDIELAAADFTALADSIGVTTRVENQGCQSDGRQDIIIRWDVAGPRNDAVSDVSRLCSAIQNYKQDQ